MALSALFLNCTLKKSPEVSNTQALIDKSLRLVIRLLQVSSLPLMSPMRKLVLDLVETIAEERAA